MVYHKSRELVDNAYFKAVDELDQLAVQMGNFDELYHEEIKEDQAEVDRLNNIFAQRIKDAVLKEDKEIDRKIEIDQRAVILEAILNERIELSDWFGPNTYTIKTTDYDDFKNGTDIVIMLDGKIPIAIDVTTSSKSIPEKVDRIADEIKSGKLTTIKYFDDENTGEKGQKKGVPRFIIGASPRKVNFITRLWMGNKKERKKLDREPIQLQLIEEIIIQAKRYASYAKKLGNKDAYIKFAEILIKLIEIFQKKRDSINFPVNYDRYIRGDKIYESIKDEME